MAGLLSALNLSIPAPLRERLAAAARPAAGDKRTAAQQPSPVAPAAASDTPAVVCASPDEARTPPNQPRSTLRTGGRAPAGHEPDPQADLSSLQRARSPRADPHAWRRGLDHAALAPRTPVVGHALSDGTLTRTTTTRDRERAADGSVHDVEHEQQTAVSSEGVTRSRTRTARAGDGSSVAAKTSRGATRGDGRVGVTSGTSTTRTAADGSAGTRSAATATSVVAGADGYGARRSIERGVSRTNASGVNVGAVGGLNGKITCNVGEPTGEPPRYPITLRVDLGGSVGASARSGAEDGDHAALGASASASRWLSETRMLDAAETARYVQALQAASGGGAAASSWREMAIVSAGVREGWAAARRLHEGGGLTGRRVAALRGGESVEEGGQRSASVRATVNAGPVRLGARDVESAEHSTRVTRNAAGGLDAATHAGRGSDTGASVGLDAGVVAASIQAGTRTASSRDYDIAIDPRRDRDGRAVAALALCRSAADYDAFVARWRDRITVRSRTDRREHATGSGVELGVAGVEVGIGSQRGVTREETQDGHGHTTSARLVGRAGTSAHVSALRASSEDAATAQASADGTASLELTHTRTQTSASRAMNRLATGSAGVLATAAGMGDDDTTSRSVAGLRLSAADLQRAADLARSETAWIAVVRFPAELADWRTARNDIVTHGASPGVVAAALATFVAGDTIHRRETVANLFRRGGRGQAGRAFEFPDSLRDRRAAYDRLTAADLIAGLDAQGGGNRADAARDARKHGRECAQLIDAVTRCADFADDATRAEMLSTLTRVRDALRRKEDEFGGRAAGAQSPQVRAFVGWLERCRDAHATEVRVGTRLEALLDGRRGFRIADRADADRQVQQLQALHDRWHGDVQQLMQAAVEANAAHEMYAGAELRPDAALLRRFQAAL